MSYVYVTTSCFPRSKAGSRGSLVGDFNSNEIVAAEKACSFWEKKLKRGSDFATDCI